MIDQFSALFSRNRILAFGQILRSEPYTAWFEYYNKSIY